MCRCCFVYAILWNDILNWRLRRWQTLIQWGACPVLPGQGCKFPVTFHWKMWSWWVRQLDAAFRIDVVGCWFSVLQPSVTTVASDRMAQKAKWLRFVDRNVQSPWLIDTSFRSSFFSLLKATGNLLQIFNDIRYGTLMLYLYKQWIPGNLSTPFWVMFPVSPCGRPRQASLRAQLPTARARLPSRWPVTQRHVIGAKPVVISGFLAVGLAAGVVYQRRVKKRILPWDRSLWSTDELVLSCHFCERCRCKNMLLSSVQGDFLERVKLPLQPSLQQVIGVLHRVDPALGNLAETVSKVTRLIKHHKNIGKLQANVNPYRMCMNKREKQRVRKKYDGTKS